jgi:hypothetical protein
MTEDITRGLDLLADEAEPAIIDTQHVISRARMRTRGRRAITASALATVALVGALVVTLGNPAPTSEQGTTPPTDKTVEGRLNRLLTEALPDVIPSNWSLLPDEPTAREPHLDFVCLDVNGSDCSTGADYNDGVGDIDLRISVSRIPRNFDELCEVRYCPQWEPPVRKTLSDGTRTQVLTYTETPTSRNFQQLLAARPDGTQIDVVAIWPQGQRSGQPLTMDEILKFATVFTYDTALPVGAPLNKPTEEYVTDDPKRPARVNQQLTEVLNEVIPAGWAEANEGHEPDEPPLEFGCSLVGWEATESGEEIPSSEGCWTYGYFRDGTGKIGFKFSVSQHRPYAFDEQCAAPECVEETLPDDTRTRVKTTTRPNPVGEYTHGVSAIRPDGTCIWVEVFWAGQRSETPITTEELLKFATAFTF